jgi:large subunit ribosomal protein L25
MSKNLKLSVSSRVNNKIDSKKEILAVFYGHKVDNKNLILKRSEFEKIFKEAGFSSLVDLEIDGQEAFKCLIKAVQKEPIKEKIIHVDFFKVDMDKKITVEVGFNLIGKSGAVQNFGGMIVKNKDRLKIECLPENLIKSIDIDLSKLATLKDLIRVSDIKTIDNVVIKNNLRDVVLSIVALKKNKVEPVKAAESAKVGKK